MVTAIIPAAGQGKRMGKDINKVFLPLLQQPILLHSVLTLSACAQVDDLIIVVSPDEMEQVRALLATIAGIKPWQVVAGGSERQYSIANALVAARTAVDIILVHDGARPLITADIIDRTIVAARECGAAGAAVPVKDTIKTVDADGFITDTPERHTLWAIQTPQAFNADILRQAYAKAALDGFLGTDDASLVERLGVRVKIIPGCYANIKVTTPDDLLIAAALLREGSESSMVRFGMGYDVHRLVDGRNLILGGVNVPYSQGLLGHSDADVLLHAIKDALLGAAALGDIGRHFPDSDLRYKGASSLMLLGKVGELLAENGYKVNNIDATVVAEKPKLASYIPEMNINIAKTLGLIVNQVNVKATTTEGLGFTGQKEGIAAYAVASIVCD